MHWQSSPVESIESHELTPGQRESLGQEGC
jgi:hypothetical protein